MASDSAEGRTRNSAIEEISLEESRVRDTCPGRYVPESVLSDTGNLACPGRYVPE